MTKYRVYCLDGMSRISSVHVVDALNDAQALVEAKSIDKGVSREFWDRNRFVATIATHPA